MSDRPQYIFTVLLIGKSQSGKSSFIRLLQQNYKCIVSLNKGSTNSVQVGKNGIVSCTTELNEYHLEINGRHYRIIDTPGLDDSAGRDHIYAMNLITTLRKAEYSLDLVLLITTKKQDFSFSFQKILRVYKSLLGLGKNKNDILAVCYTHYDTDGAFLMDVSRKQLDDVPSIYDHYVKNYTGDLGARSKKLCETLSVKPLFDWAISFQEFSEEEKQEVNWCEQLQSTMLAKLVNQMDYISQRSKPGQSKFFKMHICEMATEKIEQYVTSHTNAMANDYQIYMEAFTERDVRYNLRCGLLAEEKFMIQRNYQARLSTLSTKAITEDAVSERNCIQRYHFNKLIQDLKSEQLIPAEVTYLEEKFEFPHTGICYFDKVIHYSNSLPFWSYASAKEEVVQTLVLALRPQFGARRQDAREGFALTIQKQIRDYIQNL